MSRPATISIEPEGRGLRGSQLACLAAAVFVVSSGYGALLPLLPEWLAPLMPHADSALLSRHVGYLSGAYTAGILLGAPLWGWLSDHAGRGRVLIAGSIGYVMSLALLLPPGQPGLWGIYALRFATGAFVAAIVPIVPALVAEHTPKGLRARRFAWLGAVSLLGFLAGPGLNDLADLARQALGRATGLMLDKASAVILLSALAGAITTFALLATLPAARHPAQLYCASDDSGGIEAGSPTALWVFSAALMFVLSAFELGIVLQGRQHPGLGSREVALMFAECSLVMLAVNALLFMTSLLDRVSSRVLLAIGVSIALMGLALMAQHRSQTWMYIGVSVTAAGTGLALPVISYLAAGVARDRLGTTMGGLAAASGFGQTLGSAVGGWLFGSLAQATFGWLTLPLVFTLILLLVRPSWWTAPAPAAEPPSSTPSDVPTRRRPALRSVR